MKKTNNYAVVACILEAIAAVCTFAFMAMIGFVAVSILFTPYLLIISAALWVYIAFVGFTLFCLVASAIGILVFTIKKRRTPNRVFLGISIAAAVLNLAVLLFLTLPLIITAFSPEEGSGVLIIAIAAPAAACVLDVAEIGFAIAALCKETHLFREESPDIDIGR